MDPDDADLERYARITIDIARAVDPDEVYAAHGLDEAGFEALEKHVEDALDRAMDLDMDGIPPFMDRYTKAMSKAQNEADKGVAPMSAAALANVLATLGASTDPLKAMERAGVTAQALTLAARHFSSDRARSEELLEKLNATRGPAPKKPKPEDG